MKIALMRGAAVAALCVAGITACDDDRASITDPVARIYNSRFAPIAAPNMPRGSLRSLNTATNLRDTIRLQGLETLASGVYQVWLAKVATDTTEPTILVPASGRLWVIRSDTIICPANPTRCTAAGVAAGDPLALTDTARFGAGVTGALGGDRSSFSGQEQTDTVSPGHNVRYVLVVDSFTLRPIVGPTGDANPANYNQVIVSIEDAQATATTTTLPTTPKPLWARLFGVTGTNRLVNFSFGNYHPQQGNGNGRGYDIGGAEDSSYVYRPVGRGTVGIWDNILVVDDSSLSRPPRGYYYGTVLERRVFISSTALGTTPETYRDSLELRYIDLGPQRAPYPRRSVLLTNADETSVDPVVLTLPWSIYAASDRVESLATDSRTSGGVSHAAQPYCGYSRVLLTLENKRGISSPASAAGPQIASHPPSPAIIMAAGFPDVVAKEPAKANTQSGWACTVNR